MARELTARAINVSPFVSCQDEYSLVVREIEKDLLPAAREYKLGLLPFLPLASGLLTGKYKRGAAARTTPALARRRRCAIVMSRRVTRTSSRSCSLRADARPHHAGAGVLLAGVAAAGVERDRGRHPRSSRSNRTSRRSTGP